MVSLRSLLAAVTGVALCIQSSIAHSTNRNPIDYITQIEDADIHTRSRRVNAHSSFDITFTLHDGRQNIRLALEPNHDLIHDSLVETILGADGQIKETSSLNRADHRIYKGSAFVHHSTASGWTRAGWARITLHKDGQDPIFDGAFRIHGDVHHVQIGKKYQQLKHAEDPNVHDEDTLVVWRDSDVQTGSPDARQELKRDLIDQDLCGADSLVFNTKYEQNLRRSTGLGSMSVRNLFGRSDIEGGGPGNDAGGGDLVSTIGSTSGCPTTRKIALVGIATDCTYWKDFDSKEEMRKHILGMVNQASEVYESSFKITLGLKNITISEKGCPVTASDLAAWNVDCGNNIELVNRLSEFSAWRGKSDDSLAYWTLLTLCNTGNAVGLAWRGQLCRKGSGPNGDGSNETIAGTNVVVRSSTEWQIFAHETGHTFGAVHDCTSQSCPVSSSSSQMCCPLSKSECSAGGNYIMNPSTGDDIDSFSPCSIGEICSGLRGRINNECLVDNKNVEIITGGECGNGIVENGEDCDCGSDQECKDNPCCDAETCKYKGDSVCDPTNEECCTDQCQFMSSGTVCRNSTGECDVEETCSGTNATCPDDTHKKDGDSCGGGGDLRCASGQCTSRDLQCQSMVGGLGSSNSTSACHHDQSCLLACESPRYGSGTCLTHNQNFLDGTPCRAGGHCSNGECTGASTWDEIVYWIQTHKTIFIPVAVVVGLLILGIIGSCLASIVRRSTGRRRVAKKPDMQAWPNYDNRGGWGGGPQGSSSSGDPMMSGAHFNNIPPPPPPNYGGPHGYPPVGRTSTARWG